MVVVFTLRQITSVLDGPIYRVRNEVTAAENASTSVFVYRTSTAEFDHYASARDMTLWPDSRAAAQTAGLEYYRQTFVQRDWESVTELVSDVNLSWERVQLLASELTEEAGLLTIDRTLVLEGA